MNYNKEKIKEQFKRVIEYSQGIDNPHVDYLFEQWERNKERFIQAFGGLIYEHPIKFTFPLDQEQKSRKINALIEEIENVYHNVDLGNFILLNAHSFFDNNVEIDQPFAHLGVKKGMKLVKAFKFFEEDKEVLDYFQSAASRIIQEDKIEGTLCFSVHPLDFLSVSANTYNWRSCHALDGEYRCGNLSYMGDSTTIVCYVKGDDKVFLPGFPPDVLWNSKKWRVLLYCSEHWEYIFAGKPYPFFSYTGLEEMRKILMGVLGFNSEDWGCWTNPIVSRVPDNHDHEYTCNEKYIYMRGELVKLPEIIKDNCREPLHFNDVLRSSTYVPYYTGYFNYSYLSFYTDRITVGSPVLCLECGNNYIENSDGMVCEHCYHEEDATYSCICCGSRIYSSDVYWVGDDPVCERCFETECFVCENCGDYFFNSEKHYDRESQGYICPWCYNRKNEEEE